MAAKDLLAGAVAIAAATFGLMFVSKGQKRILKAEKKKRPPTEDLIERKILEVVEYLEWVAEKIATDPQYQKRYEQQNVQNALKGMKKVKLEADKFRDQWNKENPDNKVGPLEYADKDTYIEHFGKKGKMSSGGPFNYIFDTSGQFKNSTAKAMTVLKQHFPHTDSVPDADAIETIKKLYENPEIINKPVKDGGLGGMTLDGMGLELWNEQSSYKSRNLLKNKAKDFKYDKPLGFDIDTCREWMGMLYIENTYKGFKQEKKALKDINRFLTDGDYDPFIRFVGNFDDLEKWKGVHHKEWDNAGWWADARKKKQGGFLAYPDNIIFFDTKRLEVVFTPEILDMTWKIDLIVRVKEREGELGANGCAVMGGIQIKPLSFYRSEGGLEVGKVRSQVVRHQIVQGNAKLWDLRKGGYYFDVADSWLNPIKVGSFKVEHKVSDVKIDGKEHRYSVEKMTHGMNYFYVQNLVYDDEGDEPKWLNIEAVMERLKHNIPDPVNQSDMRKRLDNIQSLSTKTETDRQELDNELRKYFTNEQTDWTNKQIEKPDFDESPRSGTEGRPYYRPTDYQGEPNPEPRIPTKKTNQWCPDCRTNRHSAANCRYRRPPSNPFSKD